MLAFLKKFSKPWSQDMVVLFLTRNSWTNIAFVLNEIAFFVIFQGCLSDMRIDGPTFVPKMANLY